MTLELWIAGYIAASVFGAWMISTIGGRRSPHKEIPNENR